MANGAGAGPAGRGRADGRAAPGAIMPVGGAEDKSTDEPILRRFVELAGGDAAKVAVVPTASTAPDAGEVYLDLFRTMEVERVEIVRVGQRDEANGDEALAPLRDASGVSISGGDQARLVALMAGTLAMERIRQRHAAGAVVAGTSAGASILGSHMMAGGAGAAVPRKGMTEMVAGFGLLQDVIVDQHFTQRGRIGRLLVLYAANPGLLSLGIDEDTAAVIAPDGVLQVLGRNSITVLDGRDVESNYYEIEEGEVVTVTRSSLHLLGPGQRFDLKARRLVEGERASGAGGDRA